MMLILGCSEKGMFKEIKMENNDLKNIQIMGWGTGKAISSEIAIQKAKLNATVNLMDQINGRKFVYKEAENSINFSTITKGKISRTEVINSYNLDDRTVLMILSASILNRDFDLVNAYLLETEFRTTDLEKSIFEKYKMAVTELISTKFKEQRYLEGRLFLASLDVFDYENNTDFAVNMKILITFTTIE